MSGFFILKKAPGAAGTDYFILLTDACPPIGTYDAEVISFLLLVHAR